MNHILRKVYKNMFKKDIDTESYNTCCQTPDAQALLSTIYLVEEHGFRVNPMEGAYEIYFSEGRLCSTEVAVDLWNEFSHAEKHSEEVQLKPEFQVYLSRLKNIAREIDSPLTLKQKIVAAANYKYYRENLMGEEDSFGRYALCVFAENGKEDYKFAKKFYEEYIKLEENYEENFGKN